MRLSPPAASTRSRWRSRRSSSRTGRRTPTGGWGKPKRERVIPDWVASTVTQVLEQNMLYGTGTGAHVSGRTDAGKTGTTDNYADAWFSGYTPRLEATVWIGYARGEIPMLDVHGGAVSGPTFPADIWHLYMETADAQPPRRPVPAADRRSRNGSRGTAPYEEGLVYGTTSTTTATTTRTRGRATTAATTTSPPTTAESTTTAPATTTVEQPPATTTEEATTTTTETQTTP